MISGGAGRRNQARIRNKPPAMMPTASTATRIHIAVDIGPLSACVTVFVALIALTKEGGGPW